MERESPRNEERDERWRVWMAAAQAGDRDLYERLLTELLPFVRGIVRGRVRDTAAAEDILQDVLLSIHTARHTYRSERPLAPWVRAIARNAVIDWGRRGVRAGRRESDVDVESVEAAAPAEAQARESVRLSPGMERALESLPDAQRQAVLLIKVAGLSVAEAAERVGVSSGAMKLRAHRGYEALRTVFGRERR
jgi:RNA polymerase sigma-70 factor (ECF subfamily)